MGSAGTLGVALTRKRSAYQGEKINRCAPGGEAVMLKIAALLNVDPQPVDGDAQEAEPVRMLAVIDEPNCIGCTKCIQACPVDAIVGATRAMHTVMSDLCTGCNLCVAPCPTQCISLVPVADHPGELEMGSAYHPGAQSFLWNNMFKLFSRFPKRQDLGLRRRYSPA